MDCDTTEPVSDSLVNWVKDTWIFNLLNSSNCILDMDSLWYIYFSPIIFKGFPGDSDSKESACNAGDPSLILRLGRSPEEGSGNPLQYCCLENSMDRGAQRATVHGVTKSWT